MKKTPRPVMRTLLYIVLILIGLLIYAYGWQITDINLEVPKKVDRQEQVIRALRGLLSPDLFERDEESKTAYAHFLVPCTDTPPDQPEIIEGEPYITLSPTCGEANDDITIEVFNFRPYSDGIIRWTPPGRSKLPRANFKTDEDGHFLSSKLRVPTASESEEMQVIEVEVTWPVGTPRPSEALKITLERMIETIFLALMATSFAILIAIPISFFAAYNLMRQIRTPLGSFLAAALAFPIGWIFGQQILLPISNQALVISNTGWWGVPILIVILAGVFFTTTKYMPQIGPISNSLLAGLMRYIRMIITVLIILFIIGLISGIGIQTSLSLSEFLDGLISNVIGTVADLIGIMLPIFSGLGGVLILSSVAGVLLDSLLDRVDNIFIQRTLGLILGASVGALILYFAYSAINNFYNPGEPVPYTVALAIAGAVVGGVLGLILKANYALPIGFLIYTVSRTLLNVLRSIEPLIMGIVFVIWVSIGPFAGVLALTLHSIAALGKLYSEQVESIDPGPIEAITSTGATRLQTIIYGVVPQIVPPYIAFTLYRWDINVRMSTIIGFVGGGGIGFVLQQWINLVNYRSAGTAMFAIAIVVATLDYVSATMREKIV